MINTHGKYYFYTGLSGVTNNNYQSDLEKKESDSDQIGPTYNQTNKQANVINIWIIFIVLLIICIFPFIFRPCRPFY